MSDVAHQKFPQSSSCSSVSSHPITLSLPPILAGSGPEAGPATMDGAWIARSLQATIDAMPGETAVVDGGMHIVAVNQAWRTLGLPGHDDAHIERGIGPNYVTLCTGDNPQSRDARYIRLGLRRLQLGLIQQFVHNHSVVINRMPRHFLVHTARLQRDENLFLACYTDITDNQRRRAERREHSVSLLLAEQNERRRIARELHDETAQQLALMQFGLAALKTSAGGPQAESACARIEQALGAVQHQLRTLSYVLHPPELQGIGIVKALASFVRGFARRADLVAEFINDAGALRVSSDVEVALYRVAQEALANIQKHAVASHVTVRLDREAGDLVLEIADNGIGITDSLLRSGGANGLGVGLIGMRERLEAIAGRFEISRLPLGTMVTARVPYRAVRAA